MTEKINVKKVIEQAKKLGIADETKIRNMQIRDEYTRLRRKGKKYEHVIALLAEKHFRSESSITKIVRKK
jgi:hypothetical protein